MKPLGTFVALLSVDNVEARVEIHVVPDDVQAVPLLIGYPYTEQQHVVITSRAGQLLITEERNTVNTEAAGEPIKTVLLASDTFIVPDNHVGHICVTSDFKNTALVIEGSMRESAHVFPRCVIQTDEEGQALLPVLNISRKPFSL